MTHPIRMARLTFLVASIWLISADLQPSLLLGSSAVAMAVVALWLWRFERFSATRWFFLIWAILALLLSLRLGIEPLRHLVAGEGDTIGGQAALAEKSEELWFARSDRDKPDYNHSLLAEVVVLSRLTPRFFLAELHLRGAEERFWHNRRRDWREVAVAGNFAETAVGAKATTIAPPLRLLLRSNLEELYAGCRLEARLFGRGVPQRVEGGFADYVARQGASGTIFLSERYHILKSDCPPPPITELFRRHLFDTLQRAGVEQSAANIAAGIVLGQSSLMDRTLRDVAVATGILHLFAASGLHLGILYATIWMPLSLLLGRKHPLALLLPLLPVYFYLWLLSFPVSLSRATLFVSILAVLSLVQRYASLADRLQLTALLLLFLMPKQLASLSAALSFGAVTGILYFHSLIERELLYLRKPRIASLLAPVTIGLSASLIVSPLLIYAFGGHSYGSMIANTIFVPLVSLLLPLIFLLLVLALWSALPEAIFAILALPVRYGMEFFAVALPWFLPTGLFYRFETIWNLPILLTALLLPLLLYLRFGSQAKRGSLLFSRRALALARVSAILLLMLVGPLGGLFSFFAEKKLQINSTFLGKLDVRIGREKNVTRNDDDPESTSARQLDRQATTGGGRSTSQSLGTEFSHRRGDDSGSHNAPDRTMARTTATGSGRADSRDRSGSRRNHPATSRSEGRSAGARDRSAAELDFTRGSQRSADRTDRVRRPHIPSQWQEQ